MNLEFLVPLEVSFLEEISNFSEQSLAHTIAKHSEAEGLPALENVSAAIIGVQEGRGAVGNDTTGYGLEVIRSYFYKLFPGNWGLNIVDLGNIPQGNNINDTHFALKEVVAELVKKNIVPLF